MSTEQLTPEQDAQIEPYRQKWFKIGTATDPLDLPTAIDAVGRAYQAGGLEQPKYHFVAGSPISGAIAGVCLQRFFRGLEDDLRNQKVLDQVFLGSAQKIADELGRELATYALTDASPQEILLAMQSQAPPIDTLEQYIQREHIQRCELRDSPEFDKRPIEDKLAECKPRYDLGATAGTLPLKLHDVAADMAQQLSLQLVDAVTETNNAGSLLPTLPAKPKLTMTGKSNQQQFQSLVAATAALATGKLKANNKLRQHLESNPSSLLLVVHRRLRQAFRDWLDERIGQIKATAIPAEIDEEFARGCQQQFSDQANGNHDTSWSCYYDFLLNVCKVEQVAPLKGLLDLATVCGWWTPLRWVAILQHRPAELHCDAEGRLHRDGGMVVRFRDGFGFWILHGVPVPKEIAETPGEKLDVKLVLETQNVDVRREILRKIGMERYIHKIGATTLDSDSQHGYELIEFAITTERKARALKMLNPSVPEVWHVECVPPTCNTVQDALNFRNGMTPDQIDDVNGADWLQQGDTILKPRGATKFKSRPSQLT
jgi:hypothetical protein